MTSWVAVDPAYQQLPAVRDLSSEQRGLLALLLHFPRPSGVPGLLLYGRLGIAEVLGCSVDDLDRLFEVLEQADLAVADWGQAVLYLPFVAAWACNRARSPFQAMRWRKTLDHAPQCAVVERCEREIVERLRDRPALLASYATGRPVDALHAQRVLSEREVQKPATASAQPGQDPTASSAPRLRIDCAPAPPRPLAGDSAAAAWHALVDAAGGPLAVGLDRTYLTELGLPQGQDVAWYRAWAATQEASPPATLEDARRLGEWLCAGGGEGLRTPWQGLVKPSCLVGWLGAATTWDQAGRPTPGGRRNPLPQPIRLPGSDVLDELTGDRRAHTALREKGLIK